MSSDLSQTRVKICGITTVADAQMAAAAGADAIGLVFYPPSGRYLAVEAAQPVARAVGPLVTVVGLFVNASAEQVAEVVRQVPIAVLQFHGDETDEFCRQFDRPFMKAIRVAPGTDVAEQVTKYPSAVGILLDTYVKGVPGGTGEQFNWQQVPEQSPVPLILAGGLRPDNVAAAVQAVKPYGVDVSGGVESGPGQKDSTLVRDFVRAAKRF